MEQKEKQNLKLTGNGSAAGGSYKNVNLVGEETINGDLDCMDLKIVGTCEMRGNLRTKSAKLTGTMEVKGNLEAEQFSVVGTIDIQNNARVKELKHYGQAKVKGNALLETVNIIGLLEIDGDCNAEKLELNGPFRVGGLLNAGKIDIETHSKCQVKEIGGEDISIRRGSDILIKKFIKYFYMPKDFYLGQLITDTIEGDDVYVEYTQAKVVRGANIEVGPGCEIDLIEYSGTFKQHESAKVGAKNKI